MDSDFEEELYDFSCDDFLDDYTDDLLYIIEDLKSRFSTSPFFISNINLPILTNYMINCIFKKIPRIPNNNHLVFTNYYKNEIDISYNIIYNFLKRFKIILPYNSWVYFCYMHSDLYEIQNYE